MCEMILNFGFPQQLGALIPSKNKNKKDLIEKQLI